ncbi:MAG TPA: ATP-binding protein [Ktedonobacterales bacterium]
MTALQTALAIAAIALSAFSLITYLWLGLTVLLLGNRAASVTWIGGLGLLVAALFFLCHGALVGAGVVTGAGPVDVWWHLAWLPAFLAPIFWAAIGLHYVGMAGAWGLLRRLAFAGVAALGGIAALLAIMSWNSIATYGDFIRVVSEALSAQGTSAPGPHALASPLLPALAVAFVAYVGACACLPWAALVVRRLVPSVMQPASEGDLGDSALLWDANSAWGSARPALLAASLCMVVAGVVVGLVGVLTSVGTRLAQQPHRARAWLPLSTTVMPGHLPLPLVTADLVVQGALAALVLMLGWAVVRQGVLVERRLPQRGFLGHWRGTVVVAAIVATVVAGLTFVEPDSLPSLLVLVTLMATAYALFTWQSYAAHDVFLTQLRPFVDSLTAGSAGRLAATPGDVERAIEVLFTSLCRDVLGASRARLALTAGHLHRTFTYDAPENADGATPANLEWALPIEDERGVVARLTLGPRVDGAGYTTADLEVARACGQRILDAVSEFTAVQTIAQLARRRGLESELTAALPRRKLHDDVLPRLHLAMLRLESLRGRVGRAAGDAGAGATHAVSAPGGAVGRVASAVEVDVSAALGDVVGELAGVHRELAALLRTAPAANARRLEHGFCAALRAALDGEFRGAFDTVSWDDPDDTRAAADALNDIVADVLLGAAVEAIRNASRHGRGGDLHRPLGLRIRLAADSQWVGVTIADDGVGLRADVAAGTSVAGSAAPAVSAGGRASADALGSGTRSGLLTHSALLSLVGGSLAVQSKPGTGTTVSLRVPRATVSDGPPEAPDQASGAPTVAATDR